MKTNDNRDSNPQTGSPKKDSVKQTWLRQLKIMGRELLRLLQNYLKSINEKQSSVNHSNSRKRIFDHGDENVGDYGDKNLDRITGGLNKVTGVNHDFSVLTGSQPKRKRKQENCQDPWVKAWNDDADFVNDMFGFEKPRRKGKRQRDDEWEITYDEEFPFTESIDRWGPD